MQAENTPPPGGERARLQTEPCMVSAHLEERRLRHERAKRRHDALPLKSVVSKAPTDPFKMFKAHFRGEKPLKRWFVK